jgi:peptidoglycan L-alanyl-D-glutamate endopeptidase CwlK
VQSEAYAEVEAATDIRVALLLAGEHLVPPPPLPPEAFATQELLQAQPLLLHADRRWERMDAEFVQLLLRVFAAMRQEHGYEMVLLEGHRSPERQAQLQALGTHVTRAAPGASLHQHGLAADCAFVREGRVVISERDPWAAQGYALYGQVAERHGLTWGGRWQMRDLGHVEWRMSLQQARQGRRFGP